MCLFCHKDSEYGEMQAKELSCALWIDMSRRQAEKLGKIVRQTTQLDNAAWEKPAKRYK